MAVRSLGCVGECAPGGSQTEGRDEEDFRMARQMGTAMISRCVLRRRSRGMPDRGMPDRGLGLRAGVVRFWWNVYKKEECKKK